MVDYAKLDETYREEGWGKLTDKALGIRPSDVESQARQVARYAYDREELFKELLREIRNSGLNYWEPQTSRGHEQKNLLIKRVDDFIADN